MQFWKILGREKSTFYNYVMVTHERVSPANYIAREVMIEDTDRMMAVSSHLLFRTFSPRGSATSAWHLFFTAVAG